MACEHSCRAFVQCCQHCLRVQRGKQNACILLQRAQHRIVIAVLPVLSHGMQIQPAILIPDAEPPAVDGLPLLRHGQEGVQRAFLHHVMKPVGRAIRQTLDKRILPGQRGKQVLGVRVCHDELRHFDRKFVGKSHHRKEFPLFFGQRINHRSRKDG